ncbi:MAG: hypothetical protein KatS3mg110_2435 [Pirellulaceae bacterium]|nr:MAG: hypothetical protein KatS3mg110_2435 [Pirellulaceae bacterium]
MDITCPACGTVNDLELPVDVSVTCRQCGFELSTLLASLHAELPTVSLTSEYSFSAAVSAREASASALRSPPYIAWFRLQRLLGSGASGRVYQAWDDRLGRPVAIKLPTQPTGEAYIPGQVLFREARAAARLRHPGVVQIYEVVDLEDGGLAVVMEFVGGQTLRDKLHEGKVDPQQAARWMLQVCRALHYAHKRGFVHRDLKPANIAIDSDGEARILDFGLAMHESQAQSHSGEVAGTWPYMAPEQVRGETEKLDGRCDIWAVGVILYELLTGRRPFLEQGAKLREAILERPPRPLRQLDESIPRPLEAICLRCLEKDVTKRYSSAYDVAEDLKAFLRRGKLASPRVRRGWLGALAVAVLLAGAIWGVSLALITGRKEADLPLWRKVWMPDSPIHNFSTSIREKWYSVLDRPPVRILGRERPDQAWAHQAQTETVTLSGNGRFDLIAGLTNFPDYSLTCRIVVDAPDTCVGLVLGLRPAEDLRHWTCQQLLVSNRSNRPVLYRKFSWGELVDMDVWPHFTEYRRLVEHHSTYIPIDDPQDKECLLELEIAGNRVA